MNENWFCKIVGMEMGPMSFEDLVQLASRGNLRRDHPVRHGDQGAWVLAVTVEGLFPDQDSSAATADFDMDPVVQARPTSATSRNADNAAEDKSQIQTPASPSPPIPSTSHRASERTPAEPVPAEHVAPTAEMTRVKSKEVTKAPKPAKRKKIASQQRPAGPREVRLNGKRILAAASLSGVLLGAWALHGWQGQRRTTSLELTDRELVAACRELHNELNRSRGTDLTAQSLNGFEMHFQQRIQSLSFRVREAAAGSAGEKIAAALTVLAQMPRCAVSPSETAVYQEYERKLDGLLTQAGGGAGK